MSGMMLAFAGGSYGAAPVNTVAPVVSGTATVGQTLSTTNGTWTSAPAPTFTYQWQRSAVNISGATSSTYVLVAADYANTIRCVVTATNILSAVSANSNSTASVAGNAPVNTVAPAVTGTATVGQTLSTTNGTWTGVPTPTFTYQWQRSAVNISGATSSTYVLVAADYANTIRCVVTATNAVSAASANSNSTASVAGNAPANTVAPVVSGTATVGQTLSSTTGTWTGVPTPTFTYQWQRVTTNIGGATSSTYVLVDADAGNTIRCVVTATNAVSAVSANSNSTASVAATVPGAPTIGTATATAYDSATVSYTAPASNGGATITVYTATSSPSGLTGTLSTAGSGTITVSGLSASTSYTFTVKATNSVGQSAASSASNSVTTPAAPVYGVWAGGQNSAGTEVATMDYVNINSTGDATSFGSLTSARYTLAASSSSTRGVWGSGYPPGAGNVNYYRYDYVTLASAGNATTFGTASVIRYIYSTCSNNTYGLYMAGYDGSPFTANVQYITFATTGTITSWGNLSSAVASQAGCASTTRGLTAGYYTGSTYKTIDYVTIGTSGSGASFGNLATFVERPGACASATRGVWIGGYTTAMQYVEIATLGNATSFGTLSASVSSTAACSSPTRGVFGGNASDSTSTLMQYITIASPGSATTFGNLTVARNQLGACSSGHGGI